MSIIKWVLLNESDYLLIVKWASLDESNLQLWEASRLGKQLLLLSCRISLNAFVIGVDILLWAISMNFNQSLASISTCSYWLWYCGNGVPTHLVGPHYSRQGRCGCPNPMTYWCRRTLVMVALGRPCNKHNQDSTTKALVLHSLVACG